MVSVFHAGAQLVSEQQSTLRKDHLDVLRDATAVGTAVTDERGAFEARFDADHFQRGNELRPDLLVAVFAPLTSEDSGVAPLTFSERLLHFTTYPWVRAGRHEGFVIRVREEQLSRHGIWLAGKTVSSGESQPRDQVMREAILGRYQWQDTLREVAKDTIATKATAALQANADAKHAALSFSTIEPEVRDDPLVIPDNLSPAARRQAVEQAKLTAIETGIARLADAVAGPLSVHVRPEDLTRILPPGMSLSEVPLTVTFDVTCGLLHAAAGGYTLRRTRSLRDAAERLHQLRRGDDMPGEEDEDDGEPPDVNDEPNGDGDRDTSVSERIRSLVEAQVADVVMSAPQGEELPRLPLRRLRAELEGAELAAGPADTTAYHDFHTIQMAYPNVWVEALDPRLRAEIEELYHTAVQVVDDAGLAADEVLHSEINDIESFLDELSGLADAITGARRGSIPEEVFFLWPDADLTWHLLDAWEERRLIEIATETFPLRDSDPAKADEVYGGFRSIEAAQRRLDEYERARKIWEEREDRSDRFGGPMEPFFAREIVDRAARGRLILDKYSRTSEPAAGAESEVAASPMARLRRLLREMSTMLAEKYAFEYYAKDNTNFGIVATYRERWVPGSYQVGDMVGTIPLAPGESRRVEVKESRKTSRAVKELESAMRTRAGESSRIARATTEIVKRAEASTNFTMTSQGSFQIGIGSIGGTSSFAQNQATHSQATKNGFHEAVIKASHEYRNERSLEVSTVDESQVETATTSEISNPNNELTVTYLLYELERQYRVSDQIHALQPVVLVAQPVPSPGDITEAWLLRYEWVLRRVLLDDTLEGALDQLHNAFAGEELAIGVQSTNWEAQVRVVETLEGEHGHWLTLRRQLNRELVDASYRTRLAKAAADSGGLLGDIARAITPVDPVGMAADEAEAKQKMFEDQLKWVHDELEQSAQKLATAKEALDTATDAYRQALEDRTQRRTQIDQLRIHVKDNILYYLQAIWSHEPSDQRYFRLHNLSIQFPEAATVTCRVRAATPEESGHSLPGLPSMDVVIEDCSPPRWDPSRSSIRKLHEIADLDNPIGFKGNLMLFPLRTCNLITDYMMREFVDSYFGIRDPDELSEFTTDELLEYRKSLEPDEQSALDAIITRRLSSPGLDNGTVVVPTGQLYMEALVGAHTLLEPFKLAHRGYDAARAREELRRVGLENLRYAARLLGDEPLLDDPEIDKRITVEGATDVVVDSS